MFSIYKKLNWRHLLVLIFLLSMALMPYFVFAGAHEDIQLVPPSPSRDSNAGGGITTKSMFTKLGQSAGFLTDGSSDPRTVGEVIAAVINGILALVGVIFLAQMIYGGYLWMTAQGKDEQVEKARNLIQQSIIGIIIIVAAYAIVYFVLSNVLGIGGGGNIRGEPF